MIKLKTTTLCVAFAVFTFSSTYSQTEKVILYNSQPVKVELSEQGKIQSFIGVVPGYMEGYDLIKEPITKAPLVIEEPILPSSTKNAAYAVVSTEREELKYKANYATLDKVIINKLDEIAAKLKLESNTNILLTAHTINQKKNKVSTTRLASAIAYLGLKGIKADRIQTDVQRSETLINIIAVNYLN